MSSPKIELLKSELCNLRRMEFTEGAGRFSFRTWQKGDLAWQHVKSLDNDLVIKERER